MSGVVNILSWPEPDPEPVRATYCAAGEHSVCSGFRCECECHR